MKKSILIFCFIFLLTGCGLSKETKKQDNYKKDYSKEKIVSEGSKETDKMMSEEKKEKDNIKDAKVGNDNIKVFDIEPGDNITSPVVIKGEGIAFENNLIVELRNKEHVALVKEHVTIKSNDVGERGPFKITLNFVFNNTKEGFVAVYEESAKDGSELNLVEIPVKFNN